MFAAYSEAGPTSVVDRNASSEASALYEDLLEGDELTARVFLSAAIDARAPLEDIRCAVAKLVRHPRHLCSPMLWLRGAKFFMDGGMLVGSAYLRKPWGISAVRSIVDPSYRGLRFVGPGKACAIARMALARGLQPTARSVGNGAGHAMIDAYAEITDEFRVRDRRPRITHASCMTPEAIGRMAKSGIVADLQPAWLERDGATLLKQFGERPVWATSSHTEAWGTLESW